MLRLILAALFVFGAMLASVVLIDAIQTSDAWTAWATPVIIVVLFASLALALQFFNARGRRLGDATKSPKQLLRELDSDGLVVRQKFSALRCFSVEEAEDEGLHYYIELTDRRVLFLSGQYLYDYEEIEDDPELNQPRRFPCTEFEIARHKKESYVLSISCGGEVLEPEAEAPAFSSHDFKRGIPEDGAIITDKTFNQLKRERGAG
jgi:hypothetical protein